jgi:hypothetical protein
MIFYIIVVIGAIMVYGSGPVLKLIKVENNINATVAVKGLGFIVALIGILKLLKCY